MKRNMFYLVLSAVVMLSMFLSACGAAATPTAAPAPATQAPAPATQAPAPIASASSSCNTLFSTSFPPRSLV